jgi:hypothetical protein
VTKNERGMGNGNGYANLRIVAAGLCFIVILLMITDYKLVTQRNAEAQCLRVPNFTDCVTVTGVASIACPAGYTFTALAMDDYGNHNQWFSSGTCCR